MKDAVARSLAAHLEGPLMINAIDVYKGFLNYSSARKVKAKEVKNDCSDEAEQENADRLSECVLQTAQQTGSRAAWRLYEDLQREPHKWRDHQVRFARVLNLPAMVDAATEHGEDIFVRKVEELGPSAARTRLETRTPDSVDELYAQAEVDAGRDPFYSALLRDGIYDELITSSRPLFNVADTLKRLATICSGMETSGTEEVYRRQETKSPLQAPQNSRTPSRATSGCDVHTVLEMRDPLLGLL